MTEGRISLEPDPVIEAHKKDVDRTLILENLKLSVEQRSLTLMELQRLATARVEFILVGGAAAIAG